MLSLFSKGHLVQSERKLVTESFNVIAVTENHNVSVKQSKAEIPFNAPHLTSHTQVAYD